MGIVNVTPDSFSDGGRYFSHNNAIDHALHLADMGADILDIGGESTRPGAAPVSEAEELSRVIPVIQNLSQRTQAAISVDTMKPAVALAAIQAGAVIVNDVGAADQSSEMWDVLKSSQAGYVCMHMRGHPRTMQNNPVYSNVVAEIAEFFRERLEALTRHGVSPETVVMDPGIGFGKTDDHNLKLLGGLPALTKGQRPLLLGVSRKSFIARILGSMMVDRLPASLACTVWAILNGANIVRVHDVGETQDALKMIQSIQARSES